MNYKMVGFVLGRIFLIEAALMLFPMGCAAIYGEWSVVLSFLWPTLIVLALGFTIAPVPNNAMMAFLLGGVLLIVGMGLFTLGSEMSMIPLGQAVGSEITRRKKVWIITVVGFLIGMIITVAEPDLQVACGKNHFHCESERRRGQNHHLCQSGGSPV
jgi:hypothetical protein